MAQYPGGENAVFGTNLYTLASGPCKDRELALNWFRQQCLFPTTRDCPRCRRTMTFRDGLGWGLFRCRREHGAGGEEVNVSAAKNTWLENHKMSPQKVSERAGGRGRITQF
jgi:hypothetical protein